MTVWMVLGDARDVLGRLPPAVFDLMFTSPPFFNVRSYLPDDHPDKRSELGLEPTPGVFVDHLLHVTEQADRTITPWGSLAVDIGDTYSGPERGGDEADWTNDGYNENHTGRAVVDMPARDRSEGWALDKSLCLTPETYRWALTYSWNPHTGRRVGRLEGGCPICTASVNRLRLLDPDIAKEPWLITTVTCPDCGSGTPVEWTPLQWRVRNVVRWCKPNPAVGNLGDKYRPATDDIVVACRSDKRWFDMVEVRTPHKSDPSKMSGNGGAPGKPRGKGDGVPTPGNPFGAPPNDWWKIATRPFPDAHFAVMTPEVAVIPIKSMCPQRACRVCGLPSVRIVDAVRTKDGEPIPDEDRRMRTEGKDGARTANSGGNWRYATEYKTVGWTECDCPDPGDRLGKWRSGIVLDPFGGAGTTGSVASGHGRDAVLIDLDERNVAFARDRVGPMFFQEVTVEELAAILAFQVSANAPDPTKVHQ